jgi:diguanylate cyclase (GGDEF)-like protein
MTPLLDLAALSLRRASELAELERRASTDQVTGLLNRHAFFSALDRLINQSAVMYIDLDEFKSVNDQFGHTLGDRLLSVVSRRLTDALGADDVVGRIGGDEFAVLCRSATPEQVRMLGERIIEALNQTFVIDGHHIVTGASVGIAYSESSIGGRPLLDQADKALLEAKAQRKGRSVVVANFSTQPQTST